jgi:DNA-binding transcriptional ArsR family regulator
VQHGGALKYSLTRIFSLEHIVIVLATFTALAEPNRFRIVELLRAGPASVNDIGDRLRLNQPQVSKHLRVLRDSGLVDVEPRAQQRLYELRAQPLRELHDWLERFRDLWDARFEELDRVIEQLQRPPGGRRRTKARARR